MAQLLYRLGRTAYRKWPVFLIAWIVAILAIGGFAATKSKPMSSTFSIPGIPSLQAAETQKELFPEQTSADKQVPGQIVLKAPAGHTLAEEPFKSQVDALAKKVASEPQMPKTPLANPVVAAPMMEKQLVEAAKKQGQPEALAKKNAQALSPLSADKRTGTISWNFNVANQTDIKADTQKQIRNDVKAAEKNGLVAVAGGQGMQEQMQPGGASELIGIAIALVVLVITFGSFVAAVFCLLKR